uniref:Secreted protein n=1 Tax=Steinernema glaseri TaxID=37863 RepID=A0A1I8AAI6_9BILA
MNSSGLGVLLACCDTRRRSPRSVNFTTRLAADQRRGQADHAIRPSNDRDADRSEVPRLARSSRRTDTKQWEEPRRRTTRARESALQSYSIP